VIPSPPRLPVVPDLMRRSRLPRHLEEVISLGPEANPGSGGLTQKQVDRIWKAVVSLYRTGMHPALQFCLQRDGEVVVNRAIGHASGNGPSDRREVDKVLATPDTPFCIFSTSKAITATVVHLLDERGKLHIGDRVADYIPEYAAHGKDAITIGHVLSHRAGVAQIPRKLVDLDNLGDRELIVKTLCEAKPVGRPGRAQAYHAVSGGFILGEVMHRATGKSIRQVLATEILKPLGFRWTNYGVAAKDVSKVARAYVTGPPLLPPISTMLTRALGVPSDQLVEASNDPRWLRSVVPAASVVSTAYELSRFFELLRRGGDLDGVQVMEPRTVRRALTEQSYLDVDFSLGFPTRFSSGFMLGAKVLSLYGPDTELAFGHLGFTNIIAWADPERALAGALVSSGKSLYPGLIDVIATMQRIGAEAPKVPRAAIHL
jgi:CubicO group peptidase (beta-lactamase class C family)